MMRTSIALVTALVTLAACGDNRASEVRTTAGRAKQATFVIERDPICEALVRGTDRDSRYGANALSCPKL